MATPLTPLSSDEAAAYLERLGVGDISHRVRDRSLLDDLCLAHLVNVPFENLDQVFADGVGHDLDDALTKILSGRGGWCFELNGSFARLLQHLGYDVLLLGCAVLLHGPSTIVEHLALEVSGGPTRLPPRLADVGFGDAFVVSLDLNRAGPQPGGDGDYEMIPSPQGTTVARLVDGVPDALLRFKRVALSFEDFATMSQVLQTDPERDWSTKPFATRLTEPTVRLTIRGDRCSRTERGQTLTEAIPSRDDWDQQLRDWFDLERPGPWPAAAAADGTTQRHDAQSDRTQTNDRSIG